MNTPDFHKLSKYYKLPQTAEVMVASWNEVLFPSIYTAQGETKVKEVTDGLKLLSTEYKIEDSLNDLVYLILTHDIEYNRQFLYLLDDNTKSKQRKAFARLILAVNDTNSEMSVRFNIKEGNKHVKLQDPILSEIVKAVLKQGLTPNTTPFYHLGIDFLESLIDDKGMNMSAVALVANTPINTEEALREQLTIQLPLELCFSLLPYLNGETFLINLPSTNFSDRQLSFLFEVCKLLKYEPYNTKDFRYNDYKEADYLRNALVKYVKKLKSNRNHLRYAFAI